MDEELILWIVVGTALAFDFTNGFHDTANAVATSISTRAMTPRVAVTVAAALNFVGAFISIEVAATIAKGIVNADFITLPIVFAGLIGAISWNLLTWYFGLPSSSSHALIGGMVGATFAAAGSKAIFGSGIVEKVVIPALVAPVLAFVAAGISILVAYRIVGRQAPGTVSRGFRLGQILSGSLFSLSHGTNDAQKTMGIIALALVAAGKLDPEANPPTWVIVAAVILSASHAGFPLSTTHVISGGIMGAGAAKRVSAVRWGVAGNIVFAWVLTLPASAAVGAIVYGVEYVLGVDAAGPIVVAAALLLALAVIFIRRARADRAVPAEA
jgi:PiT family inorganic phosphate transporter